MVAFYRELMRDNLGGQCQLKAPLLRKMAVGSDEDSSVPVKALSQLLEWDSRSVKSMLERGDLSKLEIVLDQTRPSEERGTYVSDPEGNCTRKFVASLGELFSSSANRYKITIPRPEVFILYKKDGVKTILLTMLVQFPEIFQAKEDYYIQLSDEAKAKFHKKGLVKTLYAIDVCGTS